MPSSNFHKVLEDAGVILTTDIHLNHTLTRELPIVRYELEQKLRDEILRADFLDELKEYLKDEDNFRMALNRTMLKRSSSRTERPQKSLIHLLLGISRIQDVPMTILLEKLPHEIIKNDVAIVTDALNSLSGITTINNLDTLANNLIEYMDVADEFLSNEILHYLPRILSNRCDKIVKPLLELTEYEKFDNLAEPILKCLQNFYFSKEVKADTVNFIIDKVLPSHRHQKIVPTIVSFLVWHITDVGHILDKTRHVMDKIMSDNMEQVKLELHAVLVAWPRKNPQLITTVLKSPFFDEPKAIDIYLIMLLITHDSLSVHRKLFEALIKRHVKDGTFSLELWETLLQKYFTQDSMEYLWTVLLDVSIILIESRTPTTMIFGDVGMLIYNSLFKHPLSDSSTRRTMISRVKKLLMFETCRNVDVFLKVLLDLSRDKMLVDQPQSLMTLIPLYETLTVKNMKIIFEIVCENIVSDQVLVDDLAMCFKKLLKVDDLRKNKIGAVAAVMLAKYQSLPSGESSRELESSSASQRHPALIILEYAREVCEHRTGQIGVYYDELALTLSENTSERVLVYLHGCMQENFVKYYTTEIEFREDLRVAVKSQFVLNDPSELDQILHIDIGGLVQHSKWLPKTRCLTLPAMFRFLRTVTLFSNGGDIVSIDALLGCGVLLPDIEDLDLHSQENLPIVANCLFLCINWFRELVSAFMCHKAYRSKTIERVKQIILLEDKLAEIMTFIPNHKLPQSYFYDEPDDLAATGRTVSAAVGSKRKYDSTINVTQGITQTKSGKKLQKKQYFDFREMDNEVMLLLKYPVKKGPDTFETKQFQFVLRDAIAKMASVMDLRPRAEVLQDVTVGSLIKGTERLLPHIHKNFCLIAHELFTLSENNDMGDASVFFTPEVTDLKVTFDLVINFYKIIFDWKGFQRVENKDLLCTLLRCFDRVENSSGYTQFSQSQITPRCGGSHDVSLIQASLTSANAMKSKFIENMAKYRTQCLVLSSAGALLNLLLIIRDHMTFQKVTADSVVLETATSFLKRSWLSLNGLPEHGKEANDSLKGIISTFLQSTAVRSIKDIVNTLAAEIKGLKGKHDSLPTFAAVSKGCVYIFINRICNELHGKLKTELGTINLKEQSTLWKHATNSLRILIEIGSKCSKSCLLMLAKTSLLMLNLFLKQGFTVIEKNINKNNADVQELLNTWVAIQHFMHRIACEAYSKRLKAFLNIVPPIRTALEKMRLKVKNTFAAFDCEAAFFEGVLLNKNLSGEEILPQTNSEENSDEEDTDGDVEEVFEEDTDNMTMQSASEVFE